MVPGPGSAGAERQEASQEHATGVARPVGASSGRPPPAASPQQNPRHGTVANLVRASRVEHPTPRRRCEARDGRVDLGSTSAAHGVTAEHIHESVRLLVRVVYEFELNPFHGQIERAEVSNRLVRYLDLNLLPLSWTMTRSPIIS